MIRGLAVCVAASLVPVALADSPKPVEPFNGKGLSGWKLKDQKKSRWRVGNAALDPEKPTAFGPFAPPSAAPGELVNATGGGSDVYTGQKFGDCTIELGFMVPKGSNSGVYVIGEYEVQILDSYGKPDGKLGQGDLGALYGAAAPKKNAARKPGEWQKFVIEFRAPKFDGDKKTANAKFVKVTLNDVVLHEGVEMKGPTPGGLTGKEAPTGPLMFQGDHGPIAFRDVKITPAAGGK